LQDFENACVIQRARFGSNLAHVLLGLTSTLEEIVKLKLSVIVLGLSLIAPAARASVISIDDLADTLRLLVDQAGSITAGPGTGGLGNLVDITTPTPSNGMSDIHYDAANETLSFTFANHLPWSTNYYGFRFLTEVDGSRSDLFVIQGQVGTNPDHVTFISDPGRLTGNATDIVANLFGGSPIDFGTIAENGDWQQMFDTGPDQYFVRSDLAEVPEPASLLLLGTGLAFAGRKLRRSRKVRG
jgi:hypothetical protein